MAGTAFVPLAPRVTAFIGEEGRDGGRAVTATGAAAGSSACPAEPGKAFESGIQF